MNFDHPDQFRSRHLGPRNSKLASMLDTVGAESLEQLIAETVPSTIRLNQPLNLPEALSEAEYLKLAAGLANKNKIYKSYIGMGYHPCITPAVIRRNILENPGWYTQYTPYQAEIAQGRLEAILNFQTVVSDLTGLEIANASLLDEGTAAAEGMIMCFHAVNKRRVEKPIFLIAEDTLPQTIDIVRTKAEPLGIELKIVATGKAPDTAGVFGLLLQYPGKDGKITDPTRMIEAVKADGGMVIMACDPLSLAVLKSPGQLGADVAVGSLQRFGVPMGFGGPHAAYFATTAKYKRQIPGRIIGVSEDRSGKAALRMALQTREQHIRREKATSNICTAQALLAIMAGMYAVYHGQEGISKIAKYVHKAAVSLADSLKSGGYTLLSDQFFDTITITAGPLNAAQIKAKAEAAQVNFYYAEDGNVSLSMNEVVVLEDLQELASIFGVELQLANEFAITDSMQRQTAFLEHEIFSKYHSESEMMRYIKRLENKDLSLVHSMIPLGSCTMKLNAAAELEPISWPGFANLHPFCPSDQSAGYRQMIAELETYLSEITRFTACSLQPNSGAQGEYTGLMVIRAYHLDRGDDNRNITIIPASAHGTNPASAVMAGMKVVVVACDEMGNIKVDDLRAKAEEYADNLAALMVTYPSTHGVYEEAISEICEIIHQNGGLVYMDGANMNAQVGLTSPAKIGADVCHLNLHKTFAIPHGGGGPGMGPICVNDKLAPFLPSHPLVKTGGEKAIGAINAAPWGSASILLISYGYIRMLGAKGCTDASIYAILNANYLKKKLEEHYDVLYTGKFDRVAHEFIIDLRAFKALGIEVMDLAKRLMDYGFHAPTVSFPVPGTVMIEPTESESKEELDRFCAAMIGIRNEIAELADGKMDKEDNPLVNAPHTMEEVCSSDWNHAYSRELAAWPVSWVREHKFWPSVGRIDNAKGDRNLICTCPSIESYAIAE